MGDRWELRDLGSKNGTYLEGRRLAAGERVVLAARQTFLLGNEGAGFQLVDASPPGARARRMSDNDVREAPGALLLLPDEEVPHASIFLEDSGRWVMEAGHESRYVTDQERLWLGEEEWVLELPNGSAETLDADPPSLANLHLRIGVSRDEEHVVVTVVRGIQHQVLAPRAYHYLLAVLARIRLEEQALPEAEQGWVDREQLCQMLATDLNKLNVDIHRVRRQLSALGLQDAARIVERRSGSGRVRLGIGSVEVFSL